ncbi:hypothetical protein Aperf_G00000010071 [Anoplocephala perfoliata]
MNDYIEPPLPTPNMLVTKLKSQGFFDQTRKRCLEDVESNSDYLGLKTCVDGIVSNFLSNQVATGSKIELRERLRRRLQDDASLQRSLSHMADLLLSKYASPESLAPSINQMTCEALKVNYHEWLNISRKPQSLPPLIPDSSLPSSQVTEPVAISLLPDPVSTPVKKEPLLLTAPEFQNPLMNPDPPKQEVSEEEDDVEMEVDDPGDEMEVESSGSNSPMIEPPQSVVDHPPINPSRHADTPHKLDRSEPLLSLDENNPSLSLPVVMKNSSSFSRRISATSRPAPIFNEPLDVISDNETMGDYSPLRRRMSMAGNPVKQNSPPLLPAPVPAFQASMRSPKQHSIESNPSPHAGRKPYVPSPSRSRGFHDPKSPRRHNSNRNSDRNDRDRDRDNYRRRDRDHKCDRYRDPETHDRVSRHNFNPPSRSGVGILERQIRNPSPVIDSGSGSRDLLSRSQSPAMSRRQRQSSPHSAQTPDSRVSNFYKPGRSDNSRGRRGTPHGRDYDRHHQRRQSSRQYSHRRHDEVWERRSRRHSRESSGPRRSSPHQSRRRGNRRQDSPIPSTSIGSSLSPSRKSNPAPALKTTAPRPTGFSL